LRCQILTAHWLVGHHWMQTPFWTLPRSH